MKYSDLSLGQIESIINKVGGMDGAEDLLAGRLIVTHEIFHDALIFRDSYRPGDVDLGTLFEPQVMHDSSWHRILQQTTKTGESTSLVLLRGILPRDYTLSDVRKIVSRNRQLSYFKRPYVAYAISRMLASQLSPECDNPFGIESSNTFILDDMNMISVDWRPSGSWRDIKHDTWYVSLWLEKQDPVIPKGTRIFVNSL